MRAEVDVLRDEWCAKYELEATLSGPTVDRKLAFIHVLAMVRTEAYCNGRPIINQPVHGRRAGLGSASQNFTSHAHCYPSVDSLQRLASPGIRRP